MTGVRVLCLLLVWSPAVDATAVTLRTASSANPIRKVVNMLQMMEAKVTAEGKKAEELYDKYMCYCENADGTLGQSIAVAEAKIPQLEALLKGGGATMDQLKADTE